MRLLKILDPFLSTFFPPCIFFLTTPQPVTLWRSPVYGAYRPGSERSISLTPLPLARVRDIAAYCPYSLLGHVARIFFVRLDPRFYVKCLSDPVMLVPPLVGAVFPPLSFGFFRRRFGNYPRERNLDFLPSYLLCPSISAALPESLVFPRRPGPHRWR